MPALPDCSRPWMCRAGLRWLLWLSPGTLTSPAGIKVNCISGIQCQIYKNWDHLCEALQLGPRQSSDRLQRIKTYFSPWTPGKCLPATSWRFCRGTVRARQRTGQRASRWSPPSRARWHGCQWRTFSPAGHRLCSRLRRPNLWRRRASRVAVCVVEETKEETTCVEVKA